MSGRLCVSCRGPLDAAAAEQNDDRCSACVQSAVQKREALPAPQPDRWIAPKRGLLVADLASDIQNDAPIMRDLGDGLWAYVGGVWRPDRAGWVRRSVTARLGNKGRPAHTQAVTHYLLGTVDVMECAPVPGYLNVKNGLLDWRTGTLLPHDPAVLSTVQLNTIWDPTATCPKVDAWLADVLPDDLLLGDALTPGFIWEVIGYLCFSGNPLHKAILLLGTGRNGKGTFLRLIVDLLGAENVSSVDLHSLVTNRFRTAELFGKVANVAGDLDGAWLDSTATFKAITGEDRVTAERKFEAPFDFTPFAVPVYSANKVFGTPDTSAGYMARWVVIPFLKSFIGTEDRTVEHGLHHPDEIAGMLVKAVAGLRAVLARGNFTEPTSVAEATQRFADESDPVRTFLRDTTAPDPDGWITRADIWRIYTTWVSDSGIRSPLARTQLYQRLEAAGASDRKRRGVRGFAGRRLTVRVVDIDSHTSTLEPTEAEPEDDPEPEAQAPDPDLLDVLAEDGGQKGPPPSTLTNRAMSGSEGSRGDGEEGEGLAGAAPSAPPVAVGAVSWATADPDSVAASIPGWSS